MSINISVVIPCHDDLRVIKCLHSIGDSPVEIVLSLNGSPKCIDVAVRQSASIDRRIKIVRIPSANLAAALDVGSHAASGSHLLYMDSDCEFEPSTIDAFYHAAADYDVVKGHIIFESNSWVSSIIARTRDHHTGDVLTAYKPPLLIRKSIVSEIGGYYFDARLHWREDSDLDARIRQAGIRIHEEPRAIIRHPPLTARSDLRSAFRYGIGLARARHLGIELTEVPRSVRSCFNAKGFLAASYMCIRNPVYHFGTLTEALKLRRGTP